MTSVGWATLSVIPSMRGFASALDRGTAPALSSVGAKAGRGFSSSFTRALKFGAVGGGIGAAFGIGSFIKDSVELEAKYGKTMAQMRVATKAPADELQRLDDLAISLGKETIFSAVEASDAMLELAKNGIKPATIEAGALEAALTLAAAGSTDLTDSATAMGNTLNAFRLKGKKAASVAAALAGAANASSASVGSLAEGLQQASTVAADTGFNVQETTGILAAFANAGVAGSDAGTSLKTMLSRLLPTTNKQIKAMEKYNLSFVNANGSFKGATEIAGILNKELGDLSASERSAALNTIFGSDARRAATILTKEGAEGIKGYIKATSDQGAAEEMAQANMEGTAGAIERLKGSWETTKLEFGKSIAPVAADFLDFLASKVDDVAPKLVQFGEWFTDDGVPKIKRFAAFVRDDALPVFKDVGEFAADAAGFVRDLSGAFGKLPDTAKLAAIAAVVGGGAALKVRGGGSGALGALGKAAGLAKPIPVFVTNAGGLGGTGATPPGGSKVGLVKNLALTGAVAIAVAAATTVSIAKVSEKLAPKATEKGIFGTPGGGFGSPLSIDLDRTASSKATEDVITLTGKVNGLNDALFLVGNKKIKPEMDDREVVLANKRLGEFISKMVDAGKPVTPYINTTSIERALALVAQLPGAAHGVPTAGSDGGAPFISGAGSRAGVTFTGPISVKSNNPREFAAEVDRRTRDRAMGGRG